MKDTVLSKLDKVKDLPTLSVVIERLRKVLGDPDADAGHVSRILEDDPAIAMRVLRMANSVYYGVHEHITLLSQAVACLGQREVENIALTAAVLDVFPVKSGAAFDRRDFWAHCICTGEAAVVISSRSSACSRKYSSDELHLAGVVHDIGKMIYEMYFHHELTEVIRLARLAGKPMYAVERSLLQTDHAETGGWIARKWGMPEEIAEVIRWHHEPCHAPAQYRCFAGICHLANYLSNMSGIGDGGDKTSPHLDACVFEGLGVDPASCDDMVEEMESAVAGSELMALVE